ncbi:hypothetical protein [Arthrobacter mobilis]|uniref:Uncharacterized protein n=1 Tax=Arthrobacter mobilis TaxID=2724944 RepID=A0A7X6K5A9_9MICC|nr:hypothetical protein [Arthrobacter mobilis]NKX53979.1 hypothetical protein [Arthrobacter mobilis]
MHPGSVSPPIVDAIRAGDFPAVMTVIGTDRTGVARHRKDISALFQAIADAPHGSRSPEGHWHGELDRHYECALAAHMACIGAERAAKLTAVPRPFASKAIPKLFPGGLPVFVTVWSELYQRSPRNWDRIAHYPVMFDWLRRGLVDPPRQDGAVNLLLSHLPDTPNPVKYLRDRPGLVGVTLPALFDAAVRPSIGAAAVDSNLPPGDSRRIDMTVAALAAENLWEQEMVEAGIGRAWEARTSPFQRRWLAGLRSLLEQG